jgi:hypothetical protein
MFSRCRLVRRHVRRPSSPIALASAGEMFDAPLRQNDMRCRLLANCATSILKVTTTSTWNSLVPMTIALWASTRFANLSSRPHRTSRTSTPYGTNCTTANRVGGSAVTTTPRQLHPPRNRCAVAVARGYSYAYLVFSCVTHTARALGPVGRFIRSHGSSVRMCREPG